MSLSQLLEAWESLALDQIYTRFVLEGVLFANGDTLTFFGSCMDWQISVKLSETSFAFTVTDPRYNVYTFDSMDLLTVATILSSVRSSITEEALKVEEFSNNANHWRDEQLTTTVNVDFALLERDVKAGLIQAISDNAPMVDMLCDKYQPWVNLWRRFNPDPSASYLPSIDSDWLVRQISSIDLLPDLTADLHAVREHYMDTLELSAHLNDGDEVLALLEVHQDDSNLDAAFRIPDDDFRLMLSRTNDRGGYSCTLSCSADLGGFRSVTFAHTPEYLGAYRYNTTITTDTDLFHYIQQRDKLSLKLGDYSLDYVLDAPTETLSAKWPGGYASLRKERGRYEFDSIWGNLSYKETRTGAIIDGHFYDWIRPTYFTLTLDKRNELIALNVMPYSGISFSLTCRPDELRLLYDGSELIVADSGRNTPTCNTTIMTLDGEVIATLVTTVEREEDFHFKLYTGATTDAPYRELLLDVGAPAQAIPADAVAVAPADFLDRLNKWLSPAPEEPLAEENPDLAAPAETTETVETPAEE